MFRKTAQPFKKYDIPTVKRRSRYSGGNINISIALVFVQSPPGIHAVVNATHETMHSAPYKLDQLPVEVLRHIASLGNCEAVLALSEVNNTLRAACNDRWVYKALIDNRNGSRTPAWPHHLPLTMQSPVSSWARYALADSKAVHLNASNAEPTSVVSWAPQLFAHHRKCCLRQMPTLLSVSSRFLRSFAQSH